MRRDRVLITRRDRVMDHDSRITTVLITCLEIIVAVHYGTTSIALSWSGQLIPERPQRARISYCQCGSGGLVGFCQADVLQAMEVASCNTLPMFMCPAVYRKARFEIRRVPTIGPVDRLSVAPIVYSRASVRKRARLVAAEIQFKDAHETPVQTKSPHIAFRISQKEHSFTILHGDALAPMPGPPMHQAPLTTHFIEPELLHGCYWSLNAIPYMGFLPVNPYRVCFNDSLFACVFERKWEVPTYQDNNGWRVSPKLAEQWLQLEKVLVFLRDLLTPSVRVPRSQEHLPAPVPSEYLYDRPHPDLLILSKRLMRARYAFLLMGAEISFLYALHSNPSSYRQAIDCALAKEVHRDSLVETILDSWLFVPASGYYPSRYPTGYAKEGCARYGMFVNAATSTLAHSLAAYETFHVPVWIWWGNRIHTHTPKSAFMARRFGFSREVVERYLTSLGASWEELQSGRLFERIIYKAPCIQRPHSRPTQIVTSDSLFAPLPGEQWFEFLSRRERSILAWPSAHSDTEIINTRQLLAQSQGWVPPSLVFQWIPGPTPENLVRRRVPLHKAARVWGECKPSHRIYCAAFDEWDLCEEFTSTDPPGCLAWQELTPSHSSTENDIIPVEDEGSQRHASATAQRVVGPFPEPCSEIPDEADEPLVDVVAFAVPVDDKVEGEAGEVASLRGSLDWSSICDTLYPAAKSLLHTRTLRLLPTALQVLTDFYGICVPPNFGGTIAPHDDVGRLFKLLSCSHPPPSHTTSLTKAAVTALLGFCEYISWFAKGNGILQQPSPSIVNDWSDLNASHPSFIWRRRPTVKRMQWRLRSDLAYYFEWPTDPALRLLLFRATDVLWFLRQQARNPIEIVVSSMVALGIRFSFARVSTEHVLSAPRGALRSVPWRRTPFNANAIEYHQYVMRRARLFSSTTVLRAALMTGGIIWRLAMEHVDDPRVIMSGFSDGLSQTLRLDTRSTDWRGAIVREAGLTQNEVYIILGIYTVSAEYPPGNDVVEVSWFPKVFDHSGIDVGFWSEDAEAWYQDRLHAYMEGKEQPCNLGQWHQRLRLNRPARTLARGYETIARFRLDEEAM